MKFSKFVG